MNAAPAAVVLKAPGTNCEIETCLAFERAGSRPQLVTTDELCARPSLLDGARIFCIPGGFAHGDDIASARILATEMRVGLGERLATFVDADGGFVLGICNGFQALVKLGLLPRGNGSALVQRTSLVTNESGRYECRWVRLRVASSRCAFLEEGAILEMPVGHGEGRFVSGADFDAAESSLVALRYVDEDDEATMAYPDNPNGSAAAVAGITDESGRVLGLMPHPDRSFLACQHPQALTAPRSDEEMDGARLFRWIVDAARS